MSRVLLAKLGRTLHDDSVYAHAVEAWPSPIAFELHTLRRLLSSEPDRLDTAAVLLQTRDVAEVLLKVPVLMTAADHLAAKPSAALARALFGRVTLGDWVKLTRELAFDGAAGLVFPELGELLHKGGRLLAAISAYVPSRNTDIGHGAFRPDSEETAREVLRHLVGHGDAPGVLAAVQAMGAWSQWDTLRLEVEPIPEPPPFVPAGQEPPPPPEPEPLRGVAALERTRLPANSHHRLDRRELALVADDGRRLSLGGLIAARRCKECGHVDVFQYDSVDRDRKIFTMLDYARGHPLKARREDVTDLDVQASGHTLDSSASGDGYSDDAVISLLEAALDNKPLLLKPDWAHELLRDFLEARDRGVFWLTAPADVGKTTFAQGLVGDKALAHLGLHTVAIFLRRDVRSNANEFMSGLEAKLRSLFSRADHGGLPWMDRNAADKGDQVLGALAAVRRARPDIQRMLLVLDGLDETEGEAGGASICDFVPSPDSLPQGVYLLLTSRPLAACPDHVRRLDTRLDGGEGLQRFPLSLDHPPYRALLARYVRQRLDQTREKLPPLLVARLSAALPEAAGGVFLSVGFLTDRLRAALPHGDARTPEALEAAATAFLAGIEGGDGRPQALFKAYVDALDQEAGGDAKLADEMGFVLAALAACERAWGAPRDPRFGRFALRGDPMFAHDDAFPGVPLDALALALDRALEGSGVDPKRPYRPRFVLAVYRLRALVAAGREGGQNAYRLRLKGLAELALLHPRLGERMRSIHERIGAAVRGRAEGLTPAQAAADPVLHAFAPRWMEHEMLARNTPEAAALVAWWRRDGARAGALIDAVAAGAPQEAALWRGEQARARFRTGVTANADQAFAHAEIVLSEAFDLCEPAAAPPIRAARAMTRQAQGDIGGWRADLTAALAGADFDAMADDQGEAWFEMEAERAEQDAEVGANPSLFVVRAMERMKRRLERSDAPVSILAAARLKAVEAQAWASLPDYSRAIGCRTLEIEWRNRAYRIAPDDEAKQALARAYMSLGNAKKNGGDLAGAVQDYDRAIALMTAIRDALGEAWTIPLQNDLARAYMNRGNAKDDLGDLAGAVQDYDRAIVLMTAAIRDAQGEAWTIPLQNDLANAYMNRGIAKWNGGDLTGAVQDYDLAIVLMTAIRDAQGEAWTIPLQNDLASAYMNRGSAKQSGGDLAGAVQDHDRAIVLMTAIRDAQGEAWTIPLQNDLASAYVNRGNAKWNGGDLTGAVQDYDLAIALMTAIRDALGEAWAIPQQNDLASAYVNRGSAKDDLGDLTGAVQDYDLAIVLMTAIRDAQGEAWTIPLQNDLASAYMNRGNAKDDLGDLTGAVQDYDLAIVLRTAIRDAQGEAWTIPLQNDLARAYVNRGVAKATGGDLAGAVRDYDLAIRLREAIAPTRGDSAERARWQFLTLYYAATCWVNLRHQDHALALLDRALVLREGPPDDRAAATALRDDLRRGGATPKLPPSGERLTAYLAALTPARSWRDAVEDARAAHDAAAERRAFEAALPTLNPSERAHAQGELARLALADGRAADALPALAEAAVLRLDHALARPDDDIRARLAARAARAWAKAAIDLDLVAAAPALDHARRALRHALTLEPTREEHIAFAIYLAEVDPTPTRPADDPDPPPRANLLSRLLGRKPRA